jgi:hypothetical protein
VSFIKDYKVPSYFPKRGYDMESVVGGDADIEPFFHFIKRIIPKLLFRVEIDRLESGGPAGEFFHPVGDRGLRSDDQVRFTDLFRFVHIRQNGESHDCFAETHVVSKNAIYFLLVKSSHPF